MRIKQAAWLWTLGLVLGMAVPGHAQTSAGKPVTLDATLAADGRSVELVWQDAVPLRARDIQISRRVLGVSGADSWAPLEVLAGRYIKTRDDTITPGIPYEYRVLRNHGDYFSAGYWVAGTNVPAPLDQGTVFIALDDTLADPLAAHLTRLEDDLVSAGWRVQWLPTPRHVSKDPVETLSHARALRDRLHTAIDAELAGLRHMVLLLGHVPIVTSGRVAPDGHQPGPHATDLFYGDLTGNWPDDGAGRLTLSRLPDGKIDLPVGRVDFAQIANGDTAFEAAHLRAYLDKAHHWRHGLLDDLRVAYGQSGHLQVEQFDLRNIVGPDAITEGGHHDAGETRPWLWGVDFGDHKGSNYPDYEIKPVFAINFGSAKQKIDRVDNPMIGTLAQPFYTVAVAWGGRPSWRLHQMALGRSIGQAQMITVNNGGSGRRYPGDMDYVPTGSYPWRAPIWANLLGDPTLAAFPLSPPRQFRARAEGDHVVLDWQGEATRYLLLRARPDGDFTPLGSVTGTSFVDESPLPGARYQLRALGLQEVYAGSFHTASQGVFTRVGQLHVPAPDLRQSVTGPGPHLLAFDQTEALLAPLKPPQTGRLKLLPGGWYYLPEDGFEGTVDIAVSTSGSGQTVVGNLRLDVTALPSAPP
ncbi:hypothetical protein [Tateyamaria sp.]|uniref:hypothetical protein n=1 Tax=Tateyamaria sp. TaxID=1929288 RepID=UPI00329F818C